MHDQPESSRLLEELNLFAIETAAHEEIATYFDSHDEPEASVLRDLVILTAAEFALSPILIEPRQILPVSEAIPVSQGWGRMALLKANCVAIEWCVGRSGAQVPSTWFDVTAFGGDIAKLEAVELSSLEPPREIGEVARAVDRLEHMHRDSPHELVRSVGESGVLRLQGFLWAVKLSLPRGDLATAVADAFEAFELTQPVGGTVAAT